MFWYSPQLLDCQVLLNDLVLYPVGLTQKCQSEDLLQKSTYLIIWPNLDLQVEIDNCLVEYSLALRVVSFGLRNSRNRVGWALVSRRVSFLMLARRLHLGVRCILRGLRSLRSSLVLGNVSDLETVRVYFGCAGDAIAHIYLNLNLN